MSLKGKVLFSTTIVFFPYSSNKDISDVGLLRFNKFCILLKKHMDIINRYGFPKEKIFGVSYTSKKNFIQRRDFLMFSHKNIAYLMSFLKN